MIQIRSPMETRDHGFKFVNSFPFPFSVSFQLPFAGSVDLGDIVYGLCGGMCFSALDYFHAGRPVPGHMQVSDLPTRFVLHLWDRQLDSLGLLVVPKVIEWMLRDDIDVGRRTVQYEVPKIRRRLDKGQPVVLALIRVDRGDDPTRNHQVIATGYDLDPDTRQMKLYLYDPNHPGRVPTIELQLGRPSQGIQARQSTGEPLRGFFMIRYRQQKPFIGI